MNHQINFLAILALLSSPALAEVIAPSCSKVTLELRSCLGFIKSKAANPTPACCSGVKNISGDVKSRADRTAVCNCLKNILKSVGGYDKNTIPSLPQKCGVSINLPPIDSNTDCNTAFSFYGI